MTALKILTILLLILSYSILFISFMFIVHYTFATFCAFLANYILDGSKLFASFGIIHNFFEIAILVSFLSGGRIQTMNQFALIFTYLISVSAIILYIDWPYDALFFKFQ